MPTAEGLEFTLTRSVEASETSERPTDERPTERNLCILRAQSPHAEPMIDGEARPEDDAGALDELGPASGCGRRNR